MQLTQTKPLRIFDDHQRCVWIVNTHFDNGCRDQDVNLTPDECIHDGLFFIGFHPAVQARGVKIRENILRERFSIGCDGCQGSIIGIVNQRADNVCLMPFGGLFPHKGFDSSPHGGTD